MTHGGEAHEFKLETGRDPRFPAMTHRQEERDPTLVGWADAMASAWQE